jgi:membrane protease subunit HflK
MALAYAATGLYFVQPDEQVVVRRFGRPIVTPKEPGPHFGLPWGLDRVDRFKPREVKRVTIGPVNLGGEAIGESSSQFLTGDRNLIDVRATVQYTIHDPTDYLYNTESVDPLVARAGEAAITGVLNAEPVDRALTLGKQELGILIRRRLQELTACYGLGVTVRSVDIASVDPPPEVAEAFDNVVSAMRQRDRQINQAHSYANETQARASADSQRLRDNAQAYHDRQVLRAEGEFDRFTSLWHEYKRSPDLTARRLYLSAMSEILPRFRSKLIIDSDAPVDLSIVPEKD